MKKSTKFEMYDGWCVQIIVDDDGHLNVYLSNGDGTQVHDVGADLSCDDENNPEWAARFTTDGIERDYEENGDRTQGCGRDRIIRGDQPCD